ncbi:MAG: ATP-binding cassette domain-containing protein [Alphaproteobacteria bacterium]|nr:ATP-binding cassette domain-containing protein [Alphaproteobacteria bacterium]
MNRLDDLIGSSLAQERLRLAAAILAGALAGSAAVTLLGLSGWFLTAAALAGSAGPAAAAAFNYLLPSAAIRLLAILRTASRYGERVLGHEAALRALARIRPALFAAIAHGPPEAAMRLSLGEASARLVQDIDALENRIVRRPGEWGAFAAIIAGAGLASLAGLAPALMLLMCVAATALLGRRLARIAGERFAMQAQIASGHLKERAAALLSHGAEVRVFGLAEQVSAEIAAAGERLDKASAERARAEAAASGFLLVAGGIACALVLAASTASTQALAALAGLGVLAGFDAMGGALKAQIDASRVAAGARRLAPLFAQGPVAGEPPPALAPITLCGCVLAPGTRVALTGPSGAGKTRLFEALLGLQPCHDVEAACLQSESSRRSLSFSCHNVQRKTGTIPAFAGTCFSARCSSVLINGKAPLPASRALFSHAPQSALLPADTVRNVLLLAGACAEDALWRALEDACLSDRVRALPRGLDTWIGPSGVRLSGGERKRLALARAYLRPSPWLLLDEPTEGLDAQTERAVLARLVARLDQTGQGLILASHSDAALETCALRLHLGQHQACSDTGPPGAQPESSEWAST